MRRRGFYFSFDAFLALTVMIASLLVVSQSSQVTSSSFEAGSVGYRSSSLVGQDAMKLASRQRFFDFNASFRQELVEETVMEPADLDRTILDGISLLWAARNFTYAERATERYFDSRIPDGYGYRLQVNENGTKTVIYRTGPMPPGPEYVTSVSRLVSGHRIGRPSEGYQARARATSVTKNQTRIVSITPFGYAPMHGKMEATKKFWVENVEKIYSGTFYISVEYNGNSHFENFKINGKQYGEAKFNWIHDNGDTAYGMLDVTSALKEGENTIYIQTKGDNTYDTEPTDFQPGTKLEIKYRKSGFGEVRPQLRHERIYFQDIVSTYPGGESGIFAVQSFDLPRSARFVNASMHLEARSLDADCGYTTWWGGGYPWDVAVLFNGDTVSAECGDGTYVLDHEFSEANVINGTNVVTAYINNYGDTFWGGKETELHSNFSKGASHIDYWYRVEEESLKYGKIRVSAAEQIGGSMANPKYYTKEFDYDSLASTRIYLAEFYSNRPAVEINDGTGYETVFDAVGVRSSPTRILVSKEYYSTDHQNTIKLSDENTADVRILPESTFQWTLWVPSQVGYGEMFSNSTAALKDARERLRDRLGEFVDATGISTDSVSTGKQPYLWGPASVKLVMWR